MALFSSISLARTIIRMELRRFFMHPRSLYGLPFLMAGVFVAVHKNALAPLVMVFVVSACTLEAQFTNILYRSPNEFERLCLFALPWKRIVLYKNLATIALTLMLIPVVAVVVFYFSPVLPGAEEYRQAVAYLLSVIFTLLIYGNARSLSNPRKDLSWQFRDYAEALWMPLFLAAFSIPYFVLMSLPHGSALTLIYAGVMGIVWYTRSLPRTAEFLRTHSVQLCERQ